MSLNETYHSIEFTDQQGNTIKARLDSEQAARVLQQLQHSQNNSSDTEDWDPNQFSRAILSISQQIPEFQRLSETEVLINYIWLHWQLKNSPLALSVFKQRLLLCIKQQQLQAGCVVLLQTQNMNDLIDSEIIDNSGNIYHFIKIV